MSDRGWAEIAPERLRGRFDALCATLAAAGCTAKAEFLPCETAAELPERITRAKGSAKALRFAEEFGVAAATAAEEYPALILSLRCCDALELANGKWWPRNHLYEGVQRTAAHDLRIVDLDSSVLVVGATASTRAAVAALVKVGYSHFTLVDSNNDAAAELGREFVRAFFRAQFEPMEKNLITQLPGIYGIVVDGMETTDREMLDELIHMNFLRPGAAWLELRPGPIESPLLSEAVGAGAVVEMGARIVARADAAWAQAVWGLPIDVDAHAERLQKAESSPEI